MATKNGVLLHRSGHCQFCGAETTEGVHQCMEIFSLGFEWLDYAKPENLFYRFISVDAHALQHPEIHGRWSNHFHLTRQHLIFTYDIRWDYRLSPRLSDYLNQYKTHQPEEYLAPPPVLQRGNITTTDISRQVKTADGCQDMIERWGQEVYRAWEKHHVLVDGVAKGFMQSKFFHRSK